MVTEYALHPLLREKQKVIQMLVIGAGGNGSSIVLGLPYLHQAMRVAGWAGLHVTLADGDLVSETNCVRQPFSASDVGLNKATVLINRINLFWGVNWFAHPQHLHKDSLKTITTPHIVIGCVDTRAARQTILRSVTGRSKHTVYYLDLGNEASSGQYVLGEPLNASNPRSPKRLKTVAELYPEIADPSIGEDPLPSCSAAEALERQEPYINPVLANTALAMLGRLFRHGTLTYHGGFYNAATGRTSTLPIDAALWQQQRSKRYSKLSSLAA